MLMNSVMSPEFKASSLNVVFLIGFQMGCNHGGAQLKIRKPDPAIWPWKTHFPLGPYLWKGGTEREDGVAGMKIVGIWALLCMFSGTSLYVFRVYSAWSHTHHFHLMVECSPSFTALVNQTLVREKVDLWRAVKTPSGYTELWVLFLDYQMGEDDFIKLDGFKYWIVYIKQIIFCQSL